MSHQSRSSSNTQEIAFMEIVNDPLVDYSVQYFVVLFREKSMFGGD